MTAEIRPIAPAPTATARRKRARRFWGSMGAMIRSENHRVAADTRIRNAADRSADRLRRAA